jgi:uncharacterized iron-regulated membrane protein
MQGTENTASGPNRLYFAVWRWHFYAGLYVVPFLLMLSITGILMIWFTAIAPEYGERMAVTPAEASLAPSQIANAALAAHPGGKVVQFVLPYDEATPALVEIDLESGARTLTMDPYTGAILRDRPTDGNWNEWLTNIHGQLLIGGNGGWGDFLIEIAASLGMLLVATGIYLAWPRGGRRWRDMFVPALGVKGRAWWKSLHLVSGVWTSAFLVFFLITGLAWAGIWGGKYVQAWSTLPAEKWDNVPLSQKTLASLNTNALETVPWAIEQTKMPVSGSDAGIEGVPSGQKVVLDSVVMLGRSLGIPGRFQVAFPIAETGVWTISQDSMSYDSSDPMADRTVHVDQYSGKILADIGFADYSVPGQAMAVGIALHEGMMGWWNIALNIAFCLIVAFSCIAALVMWWKRRPEKAARLAAPPRPDQVPLTRGLIVIAVLMSMAFPVLGLTLAGVILLDLIVLSAIAPLRRVFN